MTRILFVDDEPNVLSGIRRMLRSKRRDWEMVFVESGREAIEAFETGPFAIVVSDVRMPGMDGVELLQEIRERTPQTVRIALSGYADKESTLRAVSQIHQFLTKPCEPEALKATIERAAALSRLLNDEDLKKTVSRMETLPSLPTLYDDVVRLLESGESSTREVGERIGRDAAMSAKVLQLANSALVGMPQVVADPTQATVLLGMDTIRTLVLSVRIFDEFFQTRQSAERIQALWDHSVAVAHLAKRIALAEAACEHTAECAFIGGLLHDTGKLIYEGNMPERYAAAVKLAQGHPTAVRNVERKLLGAAHGPLGAYLMGLWGFSDLIIEAIARHHAPEESASTAFTPLTAVYAANVLLHEREESNSNEEARYTLDTDYLEGLELAARAPLWREMRGEALRKDGPS